MHFQPITKLLAKAVDGGYAVPHFNVCNLETVKNIIDVAEELQSPVIFGVHEVEARYAGISNLVNIIKSAGHERQVEAAIHLDHGGSFELVMQTIHAGFDSVMFDGSTIPLDDNVRITRDVVKAAHAAGLSVEAEVGTIGNTLEYGGEIENPHLADPESAALIAATGIDALAVAIGNAHGVYLEEPSLDFALLEKIRDRVGIPLVLHGGSGIPDEQVQRAISLGIAKVNISTVLRTRFVDAMRKTLDANTGHVDFMDLVDAGSEAMKEELRRSIHLVMSAGRS